MKANEWILITKDNTLCYDRICMQCNSIMTEHAQNDKRMTNYTIVYFLCGQCEAVNPHYIIFPTLRYKMPAMSIERLIYRKVAIRANDHQFGLFLKPTRNENR